MSLFISAVFGGIRLYLFSVWGLFLGTLLGSWFTVLLAQHKNPDIDLSGHDSETTFAMCFFIGLPLGIPVCEFIKLITN